MHADGQHFEPLLGAHESKKIHGQIKCNLLCLFLKRLSFTTEFQVFKVSQGKVSTLQKNKSPFNGIFF